MEGTAYYVDPFFMPEKDDHLPSVPANRPSACFRQFYLSYSMFWLKNPSDHTIKHSRILRIPAENGTERFEFLHASSSLLLYSQKVNISPHSFRAEIV